MTPEDDLRHLASLLNVPDADISLRGEGAGAFLCIAREGKSLEAALDANRGYWVEYWVSVLGEDAEPLREETFDSAAAAAGSIDAWLLRKD